MNWSADRPAPVGVSYPAHLRVASRFCWRMIAGGGAAIGHGLLPFLFTTTGSRTVDSLHREIVSTRVDETQTRSVEFII